MLAKGIQSWADLFWTPNPTIFFNLLLNSHSYSYGRSVIWWQLRAYLMLHSSFQSWIRNHFGMTEGMPYVRFMFSLLLTDLETNSLFFNISNFSDVFDEEHFINALANDVKIEKKLPKELVKAPKSVRYFKSWSGVDYYQDEISPLWDHRQVWIQSPLCTSIPNNSKQPLLDAMLGTVILTENLC